MGLLFDKGDESAARFARQCAAAFDSPGERGPLVVSQAIPAAGEAQPLLERDDTVATVARFAAGIREAGESPTWSQRDVEDNRYYWLFPRRRPVPAKLEGERSLAVLPPELAGAP
jgi:hypothetical protein